MPRRRAESLVSNATLLMEVQAAKKKKVAVTKSSREETYSGFSPAKCRQWFQQYADDEETIGPDGIERFCKDIGVSPDNVLMLVISWKLEAERMGYYTFQEWLAGMRRIGADNLDAFRLRLPELLQLLDNSASFKEIYRYSFNFIKEKDQKCAELNTGIVMLELLMEKRSTHTKSFVEFLRQQASVKALNRDQWFSFYEFCESIRPDISNYDDLGAWPVLLDEYVVWRRKV